MIVSDSSTLILLAKISILDTFLNNIKLKVVVPKKVYLECVSKDGTFDAKLIEQRAKEGKIIIKEINQHKIYSKLIQDFGIGQGEAEAITLCIEEKNKLLTDDKKAINICKIFHMDFTTAPNILVSLYKKNKISKEIAELSVKKLQLYGRYSQEIMQKIKEEIK